MADSINNETGSKEDMYVPEDKYKSLSGSILLNDEDFYLPSLEDYYIDDISIKLPNGAQSESDPNGNVLNPSFYIENPPIEKLGYHEDKNIFVLTASTLTEEMYYNLNLYDGDTGLFKTGSINSGDPFIINGKKFNSLKDYINTSGSLNEINKSRFSVRLVGIDCPEITHYAVIPYLKEDIKYFTTEQINSSSRNRIVIDKTIDRVPNKKYPFAMIDKNNDNSPYHEIVNENYDLIMDTDNGVDNKSNYMMKIVSKDDSVYNDKEYMTQGIAARDDMRSFLSSYDDIRIILDAKTVNPTSGSFPKSYGEDFIGSNYNRHSYPWNYIYSLYKENFGETHPIYNGYNFWGQDSYKRFLGNVFIKKYMREVGNVVWVNVGKYMLSKYSKTKMPTDPYTKELSDAFKLHTYDKDKVFVVDALENITKNSYDDRINIQKEIFANINGISDFSTLKEYTVMIGDCMFFVPPTSIKVVTSTENERVPYIRSKGSMTKGGVKTDRLIQLQLYFNNDVGINGYPLKKTLPNGEEVTYHMNGLRSLMAMFKTTPFLPIENNYLNTVLSIDAVALNNIQMSTVENFPRLYSVTLTLEEFNYTAYMPEIPFDKDSPNKNYFASTICFDLMRFYYQRSILKGQELSKFDFNSREYIMQSFGNKTALQPMKFENSKIDFYVPEKDALDYLLQVKENAAANPVVPMPPLSATQKEFVKKLSYIYNELKNVMYSTTLSKFIDDIYNIDKDIEKRYYKDGVSTKQTNDDVLKKSNMAIYNKNLPAMDSSDMAKDTCEKYLNPITKLIHSRIKKTSDAVFNVIVESRGIEPKNGSMHTISIDFRIELNNTILTNKDLDIVINNIASKSGIPIDNFYDRKSNSILVSFYCDIETNKYDQFSFINKFKFFTAGKSSSLFAGLAALQAAKQLSGGYNITDDDEWKTGDTQIEQDMNNLKYKLDVENPLSIPFAKYDIGDYVVKSISCVCSNTLTKINLKSTDGYAPQYTGGQDTIIEINMQTKDKTTASMLNNLPKYAANITREYRKILSVWPLRIDSEFTRFCGVNEVLIEYVNVDTVVNFPGLYDITIRMISVDRTVRNKESLTKIDVENNGGAYNQSAGQDKKLKTYFDLNDSLSKVELYPDLELPTVEELEKAGYKIIRYNCSPIKRIYPDPDFYFVYGHMLISQVYRNAITRFFNNNTKVDEKFDYTLIDKDGAKTEITVNEDEGYEEKVLSRNAIYNAQKETLKNVTEATEEMASLKYSKDIVANRDKDNVMQNIYMLGLFDGWDIGPNIKCVFEYDREENAATAKIQEKNEKIVSLIDKILSSPINSNKSIELKEQKFRNGFVDVHGFGSMKGRIDKKVDTIFSGSTLNSDDYKALVELIFINTLSSSERNKLKTMFVSIANAKNSIAEYGEGVEDSKWKPTMFRNINGKAVPYCKVLNFGQGENRLKFSDNINEMLSNGVEFGIYSIPMVTYESVNKFYGECKKTTGLHFLDPYYLEKASEEELNDYKTGLLMSPEYCVEAMFRLILLNIKRMVKDNLYVTKTDVMLSNTIAKIETMINLPDDMLDFQVDIPKETNRIDAVSEINYGRVSAKDGGLDINKQPGSDDEENTDTSLMKEQLKELKKMLLEAKDKLQLGKIFAPLITSITPTDMFYSYILKGDYNSLNGITKSASLSLVSDEKSTEDVKIFRKYILALCGNGFMKLSDVEISSENVGDITASQVAQRIFLRAANNPYKYITHSFYDMCANDKRGRMCRAFPTFYFMFVDEGRKLGYWKLHDNFYNMSAISEIQVVKSRKIAADTAKIVMSNLFKSYTTEDEDMKMTNDYNLKDAFDSIFSPRIYWEKEEVRRTYQPTVERAKLQPGVRIHIRMGYGADASNLPIVFNGCISEIAPGEFIEIIAQGDGIELMNPLVEKESAEDIQNADDIPVVKQIQNWIQKGDTPRNILSSILTHKGGLFNRVVRWYTDGRFYNNNEYGISHFGDIDYKDIWKQGEVVQNLYEATSMPSFGYDKNNKLIQQYGLQDAPRISLDPFGKTFFDIMHICASTSPDYITAVAPFGMRSTIFFGHPRYYYAYDYAKAPADMGNSFIMEKRKPFQQYHIYTSETDIIGNMIKASDREIKTCAVGIYQTSKAFGSGMKIRKTEPMWVDFNIYPEKQKTMTVDTQLLAKGTLAPDVIDYFRDEYSDKINKENSNSSSPAYATAWRMTASNLNNSVKDMYQGEIIIIGDPTVKPHDRIFISDIYENMSGSFLAEAVVHNFNGVDGYTTSVYADCISIVDDDYEKITQTQTSRLVAETLVVTSTLLGTGVWAAYKKGGIAMMRTILGHTMNGTQLSKDLLNAIAGALGKDDFFNFINVEKLGNITGFPLGTNTTKMIVDSKASAFETALEKLKKFNIDDSKDLKTLSSNLDNLADLIDGVDDNKKFIKHLDSIKGDSKFSGDKDNILNIIDTLDDMSSKNKISISETIKLGVSTDELDIDKIIKALDSVEDKNDGLKDLIKSLNKIKANKIVDSTDDMRTIARAIKKSSEIIDDTHLKQTLKSILPKLSASVASSADNVVSTGVFTKLIAGALGISAGASAVAFVLISFAVDFLVSLALTASVTEYMERWLENLRVIQVFPLKKNKMPYTAGLDGSFGVIYGHPSYENQEGSIQSFISQVFNNEFDNDIMNACTHIFNFMFTTDNMRTIVNNYQNKQGLPDIKDGGNVDSERFVSDLMQSVASSELAGKSSYMANLLKPKVQDVNSDDGKSALVYYSIEGEHPELNDEISKRMICISEHEAVKDMMKKGEFKLAHDLISQARVTGESENYSTIENITFTIDAEQVTVNVIEKDGVIDVPFLRPEALYIMIKMCEVYKKESDVDLKKNKIILQSALKINDTKKDSPTWNSTGYVFKITFQDYDGEKVINKCLESEIQVLQKYGLPDKAFLYKKVTNDTFNILVYPPKA